MRTVILRWGANEMLSKVMLGIGLLAAVVLTDPPRILGNFGPGAYQFGWKVKNALAVGRYLPTFRTMGL